MSDAISKRGEYKDIVRQSESFRSPFFEVIHMKFPLGIGLTDPPKSKSVTQERPGSSERSSHAYYSDEGVELFTVRVEIFFARVKIGSEII